MISPRFAAVTAVLLAMTMVPTIIHSYRGVEIADGLTVGVIPDVLAGMSSVPTGRKARWVQENLRSADWLERTYRADGDEVRVFVGRSYDAKRLYHHPELALLRGTETHPVGVIYVEARPDVPLHVLRTGHGGRRGVAVYALLHGGQFVERPILFQLWTSVELLFRGRKPMTLFLAADATGRAGALEQAPATKVLLAAIAAFEAQRSD